MNKAQKKLARRRKRRAKRGKVPGSTKKIKDVTPLVKQVFARKDERLGSESVQKKMIRATKSRRQLEGRDPDNPYEIEREEEK